jgi:hypothetical protein
VTSPTRQPTAAQLGYMVTTRQYSYADLVHEGMGLRVQGAGSRHLRIQQERRKFDSTDMGDTGIYGDGTTNT